MISQENNSWKALLKSYYCKGLFHIVGGSLGHEKQYQWIIFDHDIAEILSFEINYCSTQITQEELKGLLALYICILTKSLKTICPFIHEIRPG